MVSVSSFVRSSTFFLLAGQLLFGAIALNFCQVGFNFLEFRNALAKGNNFHSEVSLPVFLGVRQRLRTQGLQDFLVSIKTSRER